MSKNRADSSQDAIYADLLLDLLTIAEELWLFLEGIEQDAWPRRGKYEQASEWTLQQTVAHLVAVAEFYRSALEHVLRHEPQVTPGFQRRRDLPVYNQQEILRRQGMQPPELVTALRQALIDTVGIAQNLTREQLSWPVMAPVFNRPLTLLELLETQATHAGLVHGAQIARSADKAPLWRRYETSLQHRMLARFLRLMALTYWPERGGKLEATFQFLVAGEAGGEWHINVSLRGGQTEEGRKEKPQVTFWAANADALFLLLTGQIEVGQALLSRKLFVRGNLLLATRLAHLFSPT